MICKKCKAVNEETYNFCNQCGTRLEAPKSDSGNQAAFLEDKSDSKLAIGNVEYGKAMLAMAIVLIFIISAAISSIGGENESQPVASEEAKPLIYPSEVLTPEEISTVAEALCPALKVSPGWSMVDLVGWGNDARTNMPFVRAASKNPWDASKWKKDYPSWFEGKMYSDQIQSAVESTLSANLGEQLSDLLDANEYDGYMRNRPEWSEVLVPLVIENCGYKKVVDEIAKYDDYLEKISTQAANIPWYPKGFKEIPGYVGFALNDTNGTCSYSFGSCAIFNIVSQIGCPSSLYVEANGLIGDVVTSWGNDTARVSPGQVARIEITFSEDIDTWELTKINCY